MKKLLLTSCLALGLTSGLLAATINPLLLPPGGAALGGVVKLNLDGETLAAVPASTTGIGSITKTGDAQIVVNSLANQYAAPFLSGTNNAGFGALYTGPDTTRYLSTGTGSVTFNFNSPQNYLGLLWGSVDDYNSLEFWFEGNPIATVTGVEVDLWAIANGDQGANGTFYVNMYADAGVWFDKVIASSSQYAFEIDNIAFGNLSVPDSGATAALLGLSLACLVFFRRKAA